MQAAEPVYDRGCGRFDFRRRTHVTLEEFGPAAERSKMPARISPRRSVAGDNCHIRAGPGQTERRRTADTAVSAGDEGDSSCEAAARRAIR